MGEQSTPFDDPADGREEIIRATYRVLQTGGYADLSIQRIADEATLSKSTIYHHFDGKEDLMVAFSKELVVAYLDAYLSAVGGDNGDDVLSRIERALDLALLGKTDAGRTIEDLQQQGIDRVYLEMRSQAVSNPRFREHFAQLDALVRERLAAQIREGVEEGVFRDVDPAAVAAFLYICIEGALLLGSTASDRTWLAAARGQLDIYFEAIVREEYREE